MATCIDCIHQYCCKYDRFFGIDDVENKCNYFKPTADVVEVTHSEWHTNTVRMNSVIATCRNCHRTEEIHKTNSFEYCPHCGADMRREL